MLLDCIGRSIGYKRWKVTALLDSAVVKPHLEYCIQFWILHCKKEVEKLEKGSGVGDPSKKGGKADCWRTG